VVVVVVAAVVVTVDVVVPSSPPWSRVPPTANDAVSPATQSAAMSTFNLISPSSFDASPSDAESTKTLQRG
jgi:hypothetical protein